MAKIYKEWRSEIESKRSIPLDMRRKLSKQETFRKRPECLFSESYTYNC